MRKKKKRLTFLFMVKNKLEYRKPGAIESPTQFRMVAE